MFYLIIAGGREFSNYPVLRNAVDYYIQKHGLTEVTIVSGKARGADTLGETYAAERGLPVWEFPADWDGLGKKAGTLPVCALAPEGVRGCFFFDLLRAKKQPRSADVSAGNRHCKCRFPLRPLL